MDFLTDKVPSIMPIEFMDYHIPEGMIIHKGIFSPDLSEYYYTLSDREFKQFDVYVIRKIAQKWSDPEPVFFNSNFSEHGMSFSPDGASIYFSSTRPTNIEGIPDTWHIWRSDKIEEQWNEPFFIDIPNLRNKLVSHPIITNSGTLYFHSSNLDYSEMDIYHSHRTNGKFTPATQTIIATNAPNIQKCTPFVSPNEDYLLFAAIGDQLDLMIAFNDGQGNWTNTRRLSNAINENGQGNPFVTPDNKFLFYTTGKLQSGHWKIKWVDFESEIE